MKRSEDHIATFREGVQLLSHCIFCTNVKPSPSDENSGCESTGGHEMGEARKVASLAIDQSEEQEGHPRGTEGAKTVHVAS